MASDKPQHVSLVAAFNPEGKLLLGIRNDDGRWTLPGGHGEAPETPQKTAVRELHEETGLFPTTLTHLGVHELHAGFRIHAWRCDVDGQTRLDLDPDQEVSRWYWVDVSKGVPKEILDHLHGPRGEGKNLLGRLFGFERSEAPATMTKAETLEKMGAMQRLAPFNPQNMEEEDEADVNNWQQGGDNRENVPSMHGAPLTRALHRLSATTPSRRDPETGGRAFLLHRGVGPEEWKHMQDFGYNGAVNHDEAMSSWTPHYQTAKNFAHEYNYPNGGGRIVSAWVPESHVHSIPSHYGEMSDPYQRELLDDSGETAPKPMGENKFRMEHEVIVQPGHNSKLATPAELEQHRQPLTTLHGRINQGGRDELNFGTSMKRDPEARTIFTRERLAGRKAIKSEQYDLEKDGVFSKLEKSKPSDVVPADAHGFTVHSVDHYPLWNSQSGKNIVVQPHWKIRTTQQHLSNGLVEKYRQDIRNGNRPLVELGIQRTKENPKKGFYWMYDGHHTLAAYRAEGIPAPGWLYEQGQDAGGPMDAPEFKSFKKSEPGDEVERMLRHPNPHERLMALKMGSATPRHAGIALRDPDPRVWGAALTHPGLDGASLLHLMIQNPGKHGRVQQSALRHPAVGPVHLRALWDTWDGNPPLQIERTLSTHSALPADLIGDMVQAGHGHLAVMHPNATEDHMRAYLQKHLDSPSSLHQVRAALALAHPNVPVDMLEDVLKTSKGRPGMLLQAAARNPRVPSAVISDWLSRGKFPGPDADSEATVRSLLVENPQATRENLLDALQDSSPAVREAVFRSQSPALESMHVERAIARGEPRLVYQAMASRVADPSHVAQLTQHQDPNVRVLGHIKAKATGLRKFGDDLATFAGLSKAVDPQHFRAIAAALDPEGSRYVSHKPQLDTQPQEHAPHIEEYRAHVLGSPEKLKPAGAKKGKGITRKLVYDAPSGSKYMVKPYHERVIRRVGTWMKHPIQGWAEMANQALYHAGGIGNLHQQVHVSEHDVFHGGTKALEKLGIPARPTKEPMLVVRLQPEFRGVAEFPQFMHKMLEEHPDKLTFQSEADKKSWVGNREKWQAAKADTRKIALMDFLTGNLDRHAGNLMVSGLDRGEGQPYRDPAVLAIDHSRSFQYIRPGNHKWTKSGDFKRATANEANRQDSLEEYVGMGHHAYHGKYGGIDKVDPFPSGESTRTYGPGDATRPGTYYDRQMAFLERYKPTFEWWAQASPGIRKTMATQLEHIKDLEVRAHIKRNFDARADLLDQMADLGPENFGVDWYKTNVPHYQPGEKTDEEKQEDEWRKGANA